MFLKCKSNILHHIVYIIISILQCYLDQCIIYHNIQTKLIACIKFDSHQFLTNFLIYKILFSKELSIYEQAIKIIIGIPMFLPNFLFVQLYEFAYCPLLTSLLYFSPVFNISTHSVIKTLIIIPLNILSKIVIEYIFDFDYRNYQSPFSFP